jgi:hypothetical protein
MTLRELEAKYDTKRAQKQLMLEDERLNRSSIHQTYNYKKTPEYLAPSLAVCIHSLTRITTLAQPISIAHFLALYPAIFLPSPT